MKLTYTQQGDYLIPDITIRQPRKALGHYGRLRKAYLQGSALSCSMSWCYPKSSLSIALRLKKPPDTVLTRSCRSL